jgi:hypothetical protein
MFFNKFSQPLATRFFELGSAIGDLNVGAQPELLVRRSKGRGRLRDSSFVWRARAHVALGFHARLRELGAEQKQVQVAKTIEHKHPQFATLAGYNVASDKDRGLANLIINWRKDFMSSSTEDGDDVDGKVIGRVKNWEAVELFTMGKDIVESMADAQKLRRFADGQLSIAAQFANVLKVQKRAASAD